MGAAQPIDVAIVGAGLAGHAAALALAGRGIACRLIGPVPVRADSRTTALMAGSVDMLRSFGVWSEAERLAAPLRTMAIIDATRRLVRARPLSFAAAEIGLDAFGWNICNDNLLRLLSEAAAASQLIQREALTVRSLQCEEDVVRLDMGADAPLRAALVVAADGRGSPAREAAGISTREWRYDQVALSLNLSHRRSHQDGSTELHGENGPCTLVPLPGLRSSLVLMVAPREGERLAGLDDAALALDIERRVHSMLGEMAIEGRPQIWPMTGLSAARYGARRVALIGEAAHVFPPIGAQGFNLTMRDAADLATALDGAQDPGSDIVLARYDDARRGDIVSRTAMVDAMNRSLLNDFLPVQLARGAGIYALDRIPALRRLAMREGLAPTHLAGTDRRTA